MLEDDKSICKLVVTVLDAASMNVTFKGEKLELNNKGFRLLEYLMKNEGKVLT